MEPDPHPAEVFLGYLRMQIPPSPAQWPDPRVARIASVSECIAKRPTGWIQQWNFNAAGLYDTVSAADAAALGIDFQEYPLRAHTFVPIRFDPDGGAVEIESETIFGQALPPLRIDTYLPGFRLLGYDAAQRCPDVPSENSAMNVLGGGFGCSPLSCNLRCSDYPVNEYCLLPTWAEAAKAAREFAIPDAAEPGSYFVFGVYIPAIDQPN